MPRVVISNVILKFIIIFSYLILFLRVSYFHKVDEKISLILAILSTFVQSQEKMIKYGIENTSTYVMAEVIFQILKAITGIIIFCINGNLNDLFLAYFFMVTGICGHLYMNMSGFEYESNVQNPIKLAENRVVEIYV